MTHVEFVINKKTLSEMITHLQSTGKDNEGNNMTLIENVIIRVADDHIWCVACSNTNIVFSCCVKINVNVIQKSNNDEENEIPIDLEEFSKMINGFNNNHDIHVIFENGIISLYTLLLSNNDDKKLEYYFTTLDSTFVQNDLINVLKESSSDKANDILTYLYEKHSLYHLNNDKSNAKLSNKSVLDTKIILDTTQLKELIKDGERIDNRIYPFEINKGNVNISIRSLTDNTLRVDGDEDDDYISTKGVKRDLILHDDSIIKEEYTQHYDNCLSSAISSLHGNVVIYLGKNSPLLFVKHIDDSNIDMAYQIITYEKPS